MHGLDLGILAVSMKVFNCLQCPSIISVHSQVFSSFWTFSSPLAAVGATVAAGGRRRPRPRSVAVGEAVDAAVIAPSRLLSCVCF